MSRSDFELPFPCGQVWGGGTRVDHPSGSGSYFAIDFNRSGDEGDIVVASAAGRVTVAGGGTYNTVIIDHGDGWTSRYLHMSVVLVTAGSYVEKGDDIGRVGDVGSVGARHLHYEQRLNGVLQPTSFHGVATGLTPVNTVKNPLIFTSQNCQPVVNPVVVTAGFYRVPDGTVYQVTGGAAYALSAAEYATLGSPVFTDVAADALEGFGTIPESGTFMRDPSTQTIYLIVGKTRYALNSEEYASLGRPPAADSAYRFIRKAPEAPVQGRAYVKTPTSDQVFQMIGGARYALSADEYATLGRPEVQVVPSGLIKRTTLEAPTTAVVMKSMSSGAIYQIVGGTRYELSNAEYVDLGNPPVYLAPSAFISRAPNTKVGGVLFLRSSANGQRYQVVDGVRYPLTDEEWAALGSPTTTKVPSGLLQRTASGAPNGPGLLRSVTTGALYQVLGGARFPLSDSDVAALDDPSFTDVPSLFLQKAPTGLPAGSWYVVNPATGDMYALVDGVKTALTPSEYEALGSPALVPVAPGWLAKIADA